MNITCRRHSSAIAIYAIYAIIAIASIHVWQFYAATCEAACIPYTNEYILLTKQSRKTKTMTRQRQDKEK